MIELTGCCPHRLSYRGAEDEEEPRKFLICRARFLAEYILSEIRGFFRLAALGVRMTALTGDYKL